MKFLADAVAFHEHCEDEDSPEKDPSEEDPSEEDPSEAAQLQQQLPGEPKNPPRSQVLGMPK